MALISYMARVECVICKEYVAQLEGSVPVGEPAQLTE